MPVAQEVEILGDRSVKPLGDHQRLAARLLSLQEAPDLGNPLSVRDIGDCMNKESRGSASRQRRDRADQVVLPCERATLLEPDVLLLSTHRHGQVDEVDDDHPPAKPEQARASAKR